MYIIKEHIKPHIITHIGGAESDVPISDAPIGFEYITELTEYVLDDFNNFIYEPV